MSTDPAQLVGTVVANRYQVIRILGAGSHGAVCEVADLSTKRPAALKLLVGDDADLAARLEREGKALSMLAHPHIVELVDTGWLDDGKPYVVTELVRGESLQELIDTRVFEPARALAIVRQLLEALHHAHAAGLIHRDIKPDNILVTEGGWDGGDFIKLLDFGVAKVVDPKVIDEANLTRAGLQVFGTPAYMAPEVAVGEPVDARSDLYSVGIVLFELLVGRVPFDHPDRVTLMRMHVTDRPPLLRDAAPDRAFAPELEQLVAQALAKLPDHRYASAIAMHAAVQTVARSLESSTDEGRAFGATSTVPPVPHVTVPPSAMPSERPVLMSPRAASKPAPGPRPHLWQRMRRFVRDLVGAARRHPGRSAAIGSAAIGLLLVLAVAFSSSSSTHPGEVVTAAPVVKPPAPDVTATARALVTQADGELAKKRFGRAIAAYERALATDRALGHDDKVRTAIARIASRGEPVNAVIALEILATRLDPSDTKTIAELASTSRYLDVRRRAFAIAERDGFASSVDRLASWTLDLQQGTCDERRDAIARLRELGDQRAVDALQKAQKLPCLAKDAAAAIAQLQPPP